WQVTAPDTVRADQWQAMHDTFVNDIRQLGLKAWFEQYNPTAQAQIVERLIEAIRKGYWDASEATRRQLIERWRELADQHDVSLAEPATRSFVAETAAGFGMQQAAAMSDAGAPADVRSTPADHVRGA